MVKDKLIYANGYIFEVEPKNGEDYSLEELQAYVGGNIEIISLNEGRILVVNEDGIALGLGYNHTASLLVGHTIVGTVLMCDSDRVK